MKIFASSPEKTIHRYYLSVALIICLITILLPSCQKKDDGLFNGMTPDAFDMAFGFDLSCKGSTLYFGHETFIRNSGAPQTETRVIENPDFDKFKEIFILKIQNGKDKKTRVTSAEIRIDGELVAGPSDFSKNVTLITKRIKKLSAQSVLEVKLNGAPGTYIELWIEGFLKEVSEPGTVRDIDGNIYKTVKLGTQEWMAENLRTTKYSNGNSIPTTSHVTLDIEREVNPKYQWSYDGNEVNDETFGKLYTWQAVTDSRNVCPSGWHVPSDAEWTTFTDYLSNNGYGYNGVSTDIAKSIASTSGWEIYQGEGNVSTDQASNNSSGFSGEPAGNRIPSGSFSNRTYSANWWTSTTNGLYGAWTRNLESYRNDVIRFTINKSNGFSVRCLKNETGQSFPPVVTTVEVSNISSAQASSGGIVVSNGGAQITVQGVCWSSEHTPTINDSYTVNTEGTITFTSWLTGLEPDKEYKVRAYATNSAGTSYGDELSFTTLSSVFGVVNDIDGTSYKTIEIGTQVWMAENLRSIRYNDGTSIPSVTAGASWSTLTTPGYCWYNNNKASYKDTYGALYNWYAVNSGNLCPTGWHVPGESDWTTMTAFLDGECAAGGKIKEPGTAHWLSPNTGATNESAYTALPGGARSATYGDYIELGSSAYFWSMDEYDPENGKVGMLTFDSECFIMSAAHKMNGFSVRCVKD